MAQRCEEFWMTKGPYAGMSEPGEHGEALATYNPAYRIEHGLVMYYPNYNDPPLPKGEAMAQKDKYKVVPTQSGLHEIVEDNGDGTTSPMDPRQLFTEKHAAQRYAKTFNENQAKKGGPHHTTEDE